MSIVGILRNGATLIKYITNMRLKINLLNKNIIEHSNTSKSVLIILIKKVLIIQDKHFVCILSNARATYIFHTSYVSSKNEIMCSRAHTHILRAKHGYLYPSLFNRSVAEMPDMSCRHVSAELGRRSGRKGQI